MPIVEVRHSCVEVGPCGGLRGMLQLAYSEGAAPLSVLAAANLAGVELAAKANPKFAKGSQPVLSLPDRYTV